MTTVVILAAGKGKRVGGNKPLFPWGGSTLIETVIARLAPQAATLKITEPLSGVSDVLGPAGFLERLSWYRDMLSDTLAEGVPTGEPQRHLYGPVRDFLARSGKGLRPEIGRASCRERV